MVIFYEETDGDYRAGICGETLVNCKMFVKFTGCDRDGRKTGAEDGDGHRLRAAIMRSRSLLTDA